MSRLELTKQLFKSTLKETKAFFHGERWKEALVFLSFLLLAFGFWLLQSLQQEYEINLHFPVKYKNVPAQIAFDGTIPETVTAKVKDKGSVLLNYTLGHIFSAIEVNMKDMEEKTGSIYISKKQIENDILKQLLATTTLQGLEPQQIDIKFSQRMHKIMPVVFNGDIQLEPGFQVSGNIQLIPQSINAYATSSLLDTIAQIKTTFVEIKKAKNAITQVVQLQKINGVNFEPETVTMTIPVEEYTEKTLAIPVTCPDLPPLYTIRIFPATVKVTCNIPLSRFKDLSENMFAIQIPYADLEQNISGTLPVTLSKKPDWANTPTLIPQKVEFILEYSNND